CLDWDTMDRNTYLDALSASQYARRHLTQEAIDHLCEPLFGGGIVLASPDRMAAADMLFYTAKLLVPHFNSPQGAGLLTRTLADRLDVELNTRVTAVRRRDDGFSVTWRDGGGGEHTDRADAWSSPSPPRRCRASCPSWLPWTGTTSPRCPTHGP
ncbi:hypothetical protein DDE05_03890, partial [Streptomyces cavourensis]